VRALQLVALLQLREVPRVFEAQRRKVAEVSAYPRLFDGEAGELMSTRDGVADAAASHKIVECVEGAESCASTSLTGDDVIGGPRSFPAVVARTVIAYFDGEAQFPPFRCVVERVAGGRRFPLTRPIVLEIPREIFAIE
jgi:hypothetical protein